MNHALALHSILLVGIFCIVIYLTVTQGFLILRKYKVETFKQHQEGRVHSLQHEVVNETRIFSFVPLNLANCQDLFKNDKKFPIHYVVMRNQLENKLKEVMSNYSGKNKTIEDHSGQLLEQGLTYMSLVKQPFVKTVCEIGFNAGHSTLLWLASKEAVNVYAFDLGVHVYSLPMATYLQNIYPGRLNVIWGDSQSTVLAFVKENPDVKCDVISVDGGQDYIHASNDLQNMRLLANPVNNVLLFNDYPPQMVRFVGRAWEEEYDKQHLKKYFQCSSAAHNYMRGFSVGKYIGI